MRIFLNPQLFLSGYGFRPRVSGVSGRRIRNVLDQLSRVETFESALNLYPKRLLVTANEQHVQFYQLDLNPDSKLNFLEENQTCIQTAISL